MHCCNSHEEVIEFGLGIEGVTVGTRLGVTVETKLGSTLVNIDTEKVEVGDKLVREILAMGIGFIDGGVMSGMVVVLKGIVVKTVDGLVMGAVPI